MNINIKRRLVGHEEKRGEQSICMANGTVYGVYSTIGTNNRSNSKLYIHKPVIVRDFLISWPQHFISLFLSSYPALSLFIFAAEKKKCWCQCESK